MSALYSFDELMKLLLSRIARAQSLQQSIHEAHAYADGAVYGYLIAGAISHVEFESAMKELRRAVTNRLALLDLQDQARKEGIA